MIRVLIIEGSGNLWGSERALLDLLDSMPNVKPAVCCPPQTPLQSQLLKRNIRTLPYFVYALHEKPKWQRLLAVLGVLRACLEFRPNIIYLNQSGSYKIVLSAAILLNLPIIAHIRIFEDAAYLASQNPNPRCLRGLIAISTAIETEIQRFSQLKPILLYRIYDAYAPFPEPSLSIPANCVKNRIACVGRLVPIKAQDILISAMRFLPVENSVECLIVGNGEEKYIQQLKTMAANGNVTSSIRWLGFVNDIVPLLRTCSVLVCPSHREPLGRVIFEAWDAGIVPVVFSGSGGAAEVVAASKGGIIYEKQEPEFLARALRDALELCGDEKARLINNGRSWMAKNCCPKIYGEAMSKIFSSIFDQSVLSHRG